MPNTARVNFHTSKSLRGIFGDLLQDDPPISEFFWANYWASMAKIELNALNQIIITGVSNLKTLPVISSSLFAATGKYILSYTIIDNILTLTVSSPFSIGNSVKVQYYQPLPHKPDYHFLQEITDKKITPFNLPVILNTTDLTGILSDTTLLTSDIY